MTFLVPESTFDSVVFTVFDKDTLGKDKSLGKSLHYKHFKLIDFSVMITIVGIIFYFRQPGAWPG